jgi:hypothetical protein
MLSEKMETAEQVSSIMKNEFDKQGIENKTYLTTINKSGVKIVDRS